MKRTTFIAATGAAAAVAGTTGTVLAQEPQAASDYTLRTVRAQVAGIIAALQTEKSDYAGHRVDAINQFQKVMADLNAALEVHGEAPHQRASDHILSEARNTSVQLIGNLQTADGDYAGHRVQAISDLQAANAQLTAALDTR